LIAVYGTIRIYGHFRNITELLHQGVAAMEPWDDASCESCLHAKMQ